MSPLTGSARAAFCAFGLAAAAIAAPGLARGVATLPGAMPHQGRGGAASAPQETATPQGTAPQQPGTEQATPPPAEPAAPQQLGASIMEQVRAVPESETVQFVFNNRPITMFRAEVLGRSPAERFDTATLRLNEVIARGGEHNIDAIAVEAAMVVRVDGEPIFAITPQDLDALSAETVQQRTDEALARLTVAFNEAVELRTPRILLLAAGRTTIATLLFLAVALVLLRLRLRLEKPLVSVASERLSGAGAAGKFLSAEMRLDRLARRLLILALASLMLASLYLWLTYSLRQFPFTRPWGEALGATLLATLAWVARGMLGAVPNLFTVLVVVITTRILVRLVRAFFDAVQQERIHLPGLESHVARPTRQIVTGILWIFAIVVAFPYLPGSDTDAFRGVSVFVGLVLSIGSTGVVNQAMSGLILMYSGGLRSGEFVKVGDIEGTVVHVGLLSTRIRTVVREMVTVPNAVMIARETTNYSRLADQGVAIRTTLTLGYDIPWRQIHAVLKLAAERTQGVRSDPAPLVLQTALSDFYVEYKLIAYVDEPAARVRQLSELHEHILDLCNEHGIQILSPHYHSDPDSPAVVPRDRWAPPPAHPSS